MAIRSILQLKAWFQKGKYPTASQFSDLIDSFFHKEEDVIPIEVVDGLADRLNDKYPLSDGQELERRQKEFAEDLADHKEGNENDFKNVREDIEDLEATDEKLLADIALITGMLRDGSLLSDTKASLIALGEKYKDVYSVAGTLKAFLEAKDVADQTISTWAEIEAFLQGITDTESLTGLLNTLKSNITEAYHAAINNSKWQTIEEIAVELEKKLDKTDVVNDLTTGGVSKALSAEQGVELARQIAEVGGGASGGGNVVLIPAAVLSLTNASTSEEILNVFGGKEALIDVVTKVKEGIPAVCHIKEDGIDGYESLKTTVAMVDNDSYALNFVGIGDSSFSITISLTGDIATLENVDYPLILANKTSMLTKGMLVSDPLDGGIDRPASAEAVKMVNDKKMNSSVVAIDCFLSPYTVKSNNDIILLDEVHGVKGEEFRFTVSEGVDKFEVLSRVLYQNHVIGDWEYAKFYVNGELIYKPANRDLHYRRITFAKSNDPVAGKVTWKAYI